MAIENKDLADLGIGLHSLQDLEAHGTLPGYGRHWLGPWRVKIAGRTIRLNPLYDPDTDYSDRQLKITEALTKQYLATYMRK